MYLVFRYIFHVFSKTPFEYFLFLHIFTYFFSFFQFWDKKLRYMRWFEVSFSSILHVFIPFFTSFSFAPLPHLLKNLIKKHIPPRKLDFSVNCALLLFVPQLSHICGTCGTYIKCPTKCGTFIFILWETSILITWYISTNHRA